MPSIRIRNDGPELIVSTGEGTLLLRCDWKAGLEIGRQITAASRAAEEIAKAEEIAVDEALLVRVGFPMGLTDNPQIQDRAKIEAGHNRELRKLAPNPTEKRGPSFGKLKVK